MGGGGAGGLNKALQLTIERNGPCDLTMNGTLSIAKLSLAECMHRLGCPCAAKAEGRLACERKKRRRERENKNPTTPKQRDLTHWTRIPFLEIELNFKVGTTRNPAQSFALSQRPSPAAFCKVVLLQRSKLCANKDD